MIRNSLSVFQASESIGEFGASVERILIKHGKGIMGKLWCNAIRRDVYDAM